MIKITPYKVYYNRQKTNKKSKVAFLSNRLDEKVTMPTALSTFNTQKNLLSQIKDENLLKAVNQLNYMQFDKNDIKHLQTMGIVLPFQNGKEALDYIKNSQIGIKFDKLESENIHAQYDFSNNYIKINELYKDTKNPAEILAISEAILHEAGHAKDGDGVNSLQEEIDCLALNAVAHRAIIKNSPKAFFNSSALIVKDGVCIYSDLFFGNTNSRTALIARLKEKYDYLPVGDFKHPPCAFAFQVKDL